MSRYTSGHFGAVSALALPVLLLDLIAWIILLAGVSALQHQCKSQGEVINGDVPVGNIFPATICRNVYRFQWWTVFLQLIILLGRCKALMHIHLQCTNTPGGDVQHVHCMLHESAFVP